MKQLSQTPIVQEKKETEKNQQEYPITLASYITMKDIYKYMKKYFKHNEDVKVESPFWNYNNLISIYFRKDWFRKLLYINNKNKVFFYTKDWLDPIEYSEIHLYAGESKSKSTDHLRLIAEYIKDLHSTQYQLNELKQGIKETDSFDQ